MSGLKELAAKWVDATATASHKPSAKNLRAMIEAEGAFTAALAAERGAGRVEGVPANAALLYAEARDARTEAEGHRAMETRLSRIITAYVAADRARVMAFCDEFETKALRQSANETGHYNDARFFDGRASAFRAVMLMLEDTTAAPRGTTTEA